MPDEPEKKDDDNPEVVVEKGLDRELVEGLVASVNAQSEKVAEAISAQPVTPTTVPDGPDPAIAYQERLTVGRKEFARLTEAGDFEGALKHMEGVYATAPRVAADDPEDNIVIKATQRNVKSAVKAKNSKSFEKYGDEVNAAIAALSLEQRLDEDAVRGAVKRVESMHIDDIVEERVAAGIEAESKRVAALPPGNVPNPSLGESSDTELHDLTPMQRQAARACGVPYKEYAAAAAKLASGNDEIISLEDMR